MIDRDSSSRDGILGRTITVDDNNSLYSSIFGHYDFFYELR